MPDQTFSFHDAQREACAAYVEYRKAEGRVLVDLGDASLAGYAGDSRYGRGTARLKRYLLSAYAAAG